MDFPDGKTCDACYLSDGVSFQMEVDDAGGVYVFTVCHVNVFVNIS